VRGVKNFIKYMNYYARELNLLSTYYDSPHGLSNPHNYSTANDQAVLSLICMENEKFARVVCSKAYFCATTNQTWYNTNKLLEDGFLGVKTGITPTAGPCLSVAVNL
jgi:serine-type D-Ala-D-Ala carboxypeptidase (penicillin-binding protein 5/6)